MNKTLITSIFDLSCYRFFRFSFPSNRASGFLRVWLYMSARSRYRKKKDTLLIAFLRHIMIIFNFKTNFSSSSIIIDATPNLCVLKCCFLRFSLPITPLEKMVCIATPPNKPRLCDEAKKLSRASNLRLSPLSGRTIWALDMGRDPCQKFNDTDTCSLFKYAMVIVRATRL